MNGCQVDTLIETAKIIIEEFNKGFPCEENEATIHYLSAALYMLGERKRDREIRRVEGLKKT